MIVDRIQNRVYRVTSKILLLSFLSTVLLSTVYCYADELTAKAAIAIDAHTGMMLYAKNPYLKSPPASTAKVMTALITLERSKLEKMVAISSRATSAPPSKVGLNEGDSVQTEDLLYALLLESANDAAVALAESVAGSERAFVNLMNKRAKGLGAKHTHFINASGLPGKGQYTTVYDLSLILKEAIKNPFISEVLKTRVAVIDLEGGQRKVALRNHNKLLWMYDGAEAGKTGYTISARHCFVGEASKDMEMVIIAVLGSRRLWDDCSFLLDKGFNILSKEETPRIYFTERKKNIRKLKTKRLASKKSADRPGRSLLDSTGRI